ncbi:hypothetical protein D3C71_89640 [compost metagenome]
MRRITEWIINVWILSLFILVGPGHAQTYNEWFRQKKTQKEYLLKQITALHTYSNYLKKGYGIVKDGTGAISDITGEALDLHKSYFFSLKSVNPELLKSGKVSAIIDFHKNMDIQRRSTWKRIGLSDLFTPPERIHIRALFDGLEKDCNRTLQELEMVVTNGKIELKDDERLQRIDAMYMATQKLYKLHRGTITAVNGVMDGRQWQLKQEKTLKQLQKN